VIAEAEQASKSASTPLRDSNPDPADPSRLCTILLQMPNLVAELEAQYGLTLSLSGLTNDSYKEPNVTGFPPLSSQTPAPSTRNVIYTHELGHEGC
jgi:hypothetical protein